MLIGGEMRLVKIGDKIVNMDNVSCAFFDGSQVKLKFWLTSIGAEVESVGDVINIDGDLAIKTWAFLCRESINVEVPASNPWKD